MGFYGDSNGLLWCTTPTEELSLWDLDNVRIIPTRIDDVGGVAVHKQVEDRLEKYAIRNVGLRDLQLDLLFLRSDPKLALFIRWVSQVSQMAHLELTHVIRAEIGVYSINGKTLSYVSSLTGSHTGMPILFAPRPAIFWTSNLSLSLVAHVSRAIYQDAWLLLYLFCISRFQ